VLKNKKLTKSEIILDKTKNENNIKKSINTKTLFTLIEKNIKCKTQYKNYIEVLKNYKKANFLLLFKETLKKRLIVSLLFKDMIHNYKIWRQIRGYPVNGQRTWSNANSCKKNNMLLRNFRIKQILLAYGKKRKNKADQLVLAEYMNKLWMKTWFSEWLQAKKYNMRSSRKRGKKNTIFIDLKNLALGITGGYKRKGKARRFNKAKNKFKGITIGLPLFFTRHLYSKVKNRKFLVDFSLLHEQRKMKSKKKTKKKIIKKNNKKKK
jgi:ribosomal protein S13